MKHCKHKKIRWLLCCLIFFIHSCREQKDYKDFQPTKADSVAKAAYIRRAYATLAASTPLIKSGDIVTRTGNDFTSQSLKTLNQRDQTFSHCGIASVENDTVFVYHALGGEFNPDQKIKREPFELFTEPYNNNGFGIFRFSIPGEDATLLVNVARSNYQKGLMFDMDFDLKTDDRMYCAEFVYKSFLVAYPKKISFPLSHIKKFEFIGVDDIFLHPFSKRIQTVFYK